VIPKNNNAYVSFTVTATGTYHSPSYGLSAEQIVGITLGSFFGFLLISELIIG